MARLALRVLAYMSVGVALITLVMCSLAGLILDRVQQ